MKKKEESLNDMTWHTAASGQKYKYLLIFLKKGGHHQDDALRLTRTTISQTQLNKLVVLEKNWVLSSVALVSCDNDI